MSQSNISRRGFNGHSGWKGHVNYYSSSWSAWTHALQNCEYPSNFIYHLIWRTSKLSGGDIWSLLHAKHIKNQVCPAQAAKSFVALEKASPCVADIRTIADSLIQMLTMISFKLRRSNTILGLGNEVALYLAIPTFLVPQCPCASFQLNLDHCNGKSSLVSIVLLLSI